MKKKPTNQKKIEEYEKEKSDSLEKDCLQYMKELEDPSITISIDSRLRKLYEKHGSKDVSDWVLSYYELKNSSSAIKKSSTTFIRKKI
jgi:hypothetical protein